MINYFANVNNSKDYLLLSFDNSLTGKGSYMYVIKPLTMPSFIDAVEY